MVELFLLSVASPAGTLRKFESHLLCLFGLPLLLLSLVSSHQTNLSPFSIIFCIAASVPEIRQEIPSQAHCRSAHRRWSLLPIPRPKHRQLRLPGLPRLEEAPTVWASRWTSPSSARSRGRARPRTTDAVDSFSSCHWIVTV